MKLKDKLLNINDAEYRFIPAFSYSLLKAIDENGPNAINEERLSTGPALEFGQLVDVLLTQPDKKDEIFWSKTIVKPTASLLELADAILMDVMMQDLTKDAVTRTYIESKIRQLGLWTNVKDPDKIREKYENNTFFDYIEQSILAKGKIIVTEEVLQSAEHCAYVLKNHEYTKDLFVETEDIEVIFQACISYKFRGAQGKGKLDLIRVDHKNKIIYPYDIKTGGVLPTKFMDSFYHFKYYLQVVSYMLAVQSIIETQPEYHDYKIADFAFIYISKKMPDVPCIYTVSEHLLDEFADGWNENTGFLELVDIYKYAVNNQIFNVEKKVIDKKGMLKIELR